MLEFFLLPVHSNNNNSNTTNQNLMTKKLN
jgi:hypothetical protein